MFVCVDLEVITAVVDDKGVEKMHMAVPCVPVTWLSVLSVIAWVAW